ncbi:MAG: MMPL family transporter [Isosphaeraceae bacterium]
MALSSLRSVVSRRPFLMVGGWLVVAAVVGLTAPDLSRLSAEGQAKLLPGDVESRLAAKLLRRTWPDQAYESLVVASLHRAGGLTDGDRTYIRKLADRFAASDRPREILRVLGPASEPEVAERLTSRDGSVSLVVVPLSSSFVIPASQTAVAWLQSATLGNDLQPPAGLEVGWTGDAVIGRDYMAHVQTSLDRAAIATVILLLGVLLVVYRSFLLALVPLVTIGLSLVVSRGVLGWMVTAGWEISPLVELFLVAVLFGCGTDFCLFLSWRFAEHFDAEDPSGAMDRTQNCSALALLTSAGTVVVGLLLMGTTRFKLFSSTGPSVAVGLILTLAATLSLAPALLVLLVRYRPSAFRGMTSSSSNLWERFGARAMRRPLLSWGCTLLLMLPFVFVGLRTHMSQDLLSEMPQSTPSAQTFRQLGEKFEQGRLAPLTIVLDSNRDFRTSEGLAVLDDVSRFLSHERRLTEVRSATQPLGSPETLRRARLASRVGEVNGGLKQMADGASQLQKGLFEGAAKLRTALWLERKTGVPLTGNQSPTPAGNPSAQGPARQAILSGLKRAGSALIGTSTSFPVPWQPGQDEIHEAEAAREAAPAESAGAAGADRREMLADELVRAAEGARRIAEGASLADREVSAILNDPVGRRALDKLMLDERTVKAHPELGRSFEVYISKDGRRARFDLSQADPVFSDRAMDHVDNLRRKLSDYLADVEGPPIRALFSGTNADGSDVRSLTRSDQFQSWFVIPIGVFLVLVLARRARPARLHEPGGDR